MRGSPIGEGGHCATRGVRIGRRPFVTAAGATDGILAEPAPFVLQTALNDFYVSYELNAYTRDASRIARIYSDLHANIQDRFNEAGMEIMSPHVSALRDGNAPAMPEAPEGPRPGRRLSRFSSSWLPSY